jgi:tetratricopeptide (TPR) repeat protein
VGSVISLESAQTRHAEYFYTAIKQARQLYQDLNLSITSLSALNIEWANISLSFDFLTSMIHRDSNCAILCNNFVGELGFYFTLIKHPSEYLDWLHTGVQAAKILKDQTVENNHLGNIGNCYFYIGDYEKALLIFEECLLNYQDTGDFLGESRTFSGIGTVYAAKGERGTAIEYFEKSLEIAERVDDWSLIANSLLNLGGVYNEEGKPKDALPMLKRSLELFTVNNDPKGKLQALNNIASAYILSGENNKAINHLITALQEAQKLDVKREIAHILGSMGIVLSNLKRIDEASMLFNESLLISLEIEDIHLVNITRENLSILTRWKN